MCKLQEEAMERNDEITERRVADRRVVAVAGSVDRNSIVRALDGVHIEDGTKAAFEHVVDLICQAAAPPVDAAPSVAHNGDALTTLLAEVEKSLALHDYVTGGVDYGYISTGLQAAFDAVKSTAPQQVDAVQAVQEGWRLVPIEPTAEMRAACDTEYHKPGATYGSLCRAIVLASPSPAVPPEPTKDRIKEIAVAMAVKVAKNAGTVPQLCFPDIYLDLTEFFAGQAAQGAVPEANSTGETE